MFRLSFKSSIHVLGSDEPVNACFFQDFEVLPAALFWLDSSAKSLNGFEFVKLEKIFENETSQK